MADKVYIPYPAKGISEQYGYSFQEELTSRDERNMRTRDPKTGRLRGAQRSGLALHKDVAAQCNGSNKIKELAQVVEALGDAAYTTLSTAEEQWNNGDNTSPDYQQSNPEGRVVRTELTDEGQLAVLFDNFKLQVWNPEGSLLQTIDLPNLAESTTVWKGMGIDYQRTIWVVGWISIAGFGPRKFLASYNYNDSLDPPQWEQGKLELIDTTWSGASQQEQLLDVCFTIEDSLPRMYLLWCYKDLDGGEVFGVDQPVNIRAFGVFRITNYEYDQQQWQEDILWKRFVPSQPFTGINWASNDVTPYNASRGMEAAQQWGYFEGTIIPLPGLNEACAFSILCVDPSVSYQLEWAFTATVRLAPLTSDYAVSDDALLSSWTQSRTGRLVFTDDGAGPSSGSLNSSVYTPGDSGNGTGMGLCNAGLSEEGDIAIAMYGEALNKFEEIFTVNSKPVAGDKITIVGPTLNDPDTYGTHVVQFVNGSSGVGLNAWRHTIDTGTRVVTTSIYLGDLSAFPTTAWKWAHILIIAQSSARQFGVAGGTYIGDGSGNEYDDYGPNCYLQEVVDQSGRVGITHPDLFTQLTSSSYWFVTEVSDWTNVAAGGFNLFTNGTSNTLRRAVLRQGIEDLTNPDAYQLNFDETERRPFTNGAADNNHRQLGMKADSIGDLHIPWGRSSGTADYNDHELIVVSNFYTANATITTFECDCPPGPQTHALPEPVRPDSHSELSHAEYCAIMGPKDTGDDDATIWMFKLSTEDSVTNPVRNLHTIAVSGDQVRKHTASGWQAPQMDATLDPDAVYVQAAVGFEEIFITDSLRYYVYEPNEGNTYGRVSQMRANTIAPIPRYCKLIETWRDRVVIARDPQDPGRWHMSAIGDPYDWDMAPLVPTLSSAASSTNTEAGRVPDIINSVVPWTDDLILFGGDRTIWQLNGDPNFPTSTFDLISDETGMGFGRPYCKDPEGGLWFMGNGTGFFYMAPGNRPVRISLGKVEEQLRSIDLTTHYFRLAWNQQDEGVHIFQMPFGAGGTIVDHWFYEMPAQAWHKDRFGAAANLIQPTAVCRSNGDDPGDRALLVGGEDGRLRQFASTTATSRSSDQKDATTDVAIDSYVLIGPMANNPIQGSQMMTEFAAVLSSTQHGCNYEWFASDDPETLGAPVAAGQLQAGRNDSQLIRVNGDHVWLRLRNARNNERWAYEGGMAMRQYGGDLRR